MNLKTILILAVIFITWMVVNYHIYFYYNYNTLFKTEIKWTEKYFSYGDKKFDLGFKDNGNVVWRVHKEANKQGR